jgi:hypothetical protein
MHPAGSTRSRLREAVHLLDPNGSPSELDEATTAAVTRLAESGLVETVGKGRSARVRCSGTGVQTIYELGLALTGSRSVDGFPTWTRLRDLGLSALALGLHPPSTPDTARRFASVGGLRASILNVRYSLELEAFPSQSQALDALAWKLLARAMDTGLESWRDQRFGTGAALSCVVGHEFGLRRAEKPAKLAGLAAAAALHARGTDARSLRLAVLREWHRPTRSETSPQTATSHGVDDDRLLGWLRTRKPGLGRGAFGSGKVFVSDLWHAVATEHPDWFASTEAFKQRLLRLARDRRIELVRADLVEAMDPRTVAESEIRDLHATFHFVRLP